MKLQYEKDVEYSTEYNTKIRTKKTSLNNLIREFKYAIKNADKTDNEAELNGFISAKISPFNIIMVMDIDYPDFMEDTVNLLKYHGTPHTVIESGNNKYWIIVDSFSNNRISMAYKMNKFTGIDPEYIRYGARRGFKLRAYPKNGFKPNVVSSYGIGSSLYKEYVNAIVDYWGLPHIEWIIREQIMTNI
jgi:hypothetical protein